MAENTFLDKGLAVFQGAGLDSWAVNKIFTSPLGEGVGKAGMGLAAAGGKIRKGIFIWKEPETRQRRVIRNQHTRIGSDTLGRTPTAVTEDVAVSVPNKFVFGMNPESIREDSNPTYAETQIPGQNRPMYQFINGGEWNITFTLNFFYAKRRREHVLEEIRTLQDLTQRRYNDPDATGVYQGPPVIFFYFGEYFKGEPFILRRVQVKSFDLFDPVRLLPMRADVELSLSHIMQTTQREDLNISSREQIGDSVRSSISSVVGVVGNLGGF